MNRLLRYASITALPALAGLLLCSNIYPQYFPYGLSSTHAIATAKSNSLQVNSNGLFGYNLEADFDSSRCSSQPLQLNGVIVRNGEYFFNIVGGSPQRLYKSGELIDGQYPLIAYSSKRVLLRVAGKEVLLCNNLPGPKAVTGEPSPPRLARNITTPYFTLSPKTDGKQNVTGYAIRNCTYRCKIALKAAGLEVDDIITAVNGTPFTHPEVLQDLKPQIAQSGSLRFVVLRNEKNQEIIIRHADRLAGLLPAQN